MLAAAATTGGVLLGLAPAAQIRLIRQRGTSEGYWLVLLLGMSTWLAYGIALGNPAMIVSNTVSATMSAVMVGTCWWHRPGRMTALASTPNRPRPR